MSATTVVKENISPAVLVPAQDTLKHKKDAAQARIPVLLPDMFVSFLAQRPRVNPHYERVRMESEAWINKFVYNFVSVLR